MFAVALNVTLWMETFVNREMNRTATTPQRLGRQAGAEQSRIRIRMVVAANWCSSVRGMHAPLFSGLHKPSYNSSTSGNRYSDIFPPKTAYSYSR